MVDILTGPAGHSAIKRAETARNTEHDIVPIHRRLMADMIARGLGTAKKCLTVMMGLVKVSNFFLTQQLNPLRSWWNIGCPLVLTTCLVFTFLQESSPLPVLLTSFWRQQFYRLFKRHSFLGTLLHTLLQPRADILFICFPTAGRSGNTSICKFF